MSVQVGNEDSDFSEVMVDINTTPLIDVMLVLLIMLILTVPVLTHAVKLDMPVQTQMTSLPPVVVRIDVADDGSVRWEGEIVAGEDELEKRFRAIAAMMPQPEVHLRPEGKARYASVAMVMAAAQRQHIVKFGIIGNERFTAASR